jgi:hypothetical protein
MGKSIKKKNRGEAFPALGFAEWGKPTYLSIQGHFKSHRK